MLNKILKIVGYVVFGISTLVILHFFIADVGGLNEELAKTEDLSSDMKVAAVEGIATGWGGLILNFSMVMFIICAVAAVGFAVYQFVMNIIEKPKKARGTAIIILGTAIIVFISYSLASSTIPDFLGKDQIEITEGTSRMIETFMFVMYFIFGMSIVALIYNEVSRIWK
ncbi:MAG: hypothetical protein PHE56_04980 [Bacteroidales bacterium]|jgi:hypothetical protein|nr:hypothetical protein [Bacteroidales bacterium]